MKYAFFPGCVLESAAKEDYLATVAVAKKLGIELEELDGWTCCGASHVKISLQKLHLLQMLVTLHWQKKKV